jgi:hypothetical protein
MKRLEKRKEKKAQKKAAMELAKQGSHLVSALLMQQQQCVSQLLV